ncbi:cytosolic arginine sensor for mTORC1 subunit 1-like [Seriola lalandi dorsalis]|uniref:cytosolic arginine sensor for mTORC1 subunit 1-like n=1 Tax=Seriola lalandi dorsalis TaxID=1841481 RepID=UPI000C6F570F|nr:cytosolic arginine sensor for mTORC1 subunit 1-like [Seriola lalandi dorsalis]
MDLHILDHRLRVTSISKNGLVNFTHPLIKLIFLRNRTRCKFFSLTETPENYTVVLDEEGFKVAQQHVSVFMLSTYQTDFILVKEKDLSVVISTLEEEFNIYKEVGGESVPVHCQDVSSGLQKNGKEAIQPTVHPVLIPQNQFCVMSLDPDTLPSIATTLIDVLFYSSSPKEDTQSSPNQDLDCIKFFSFSLIDGYISLVMDTEAQRQFPADLLFTSSSGELWRMVRIGGQPLGFDECGIVAQISQPLADSDISAYYISTFSFDHALVPEEDIVSVTDMLQHQRKEPATS